MSDRPRLALFASFLAVAACGDEDHDHGHDSEIISTVELTFTPEGDGDAVMAAFTDPDGDGGMSGTADPIALELDTTYTLEIRFLNDLADPAVDITEEIEDEAEDHLILISGDGVDGPASTTTAVLVTHAYADAESDYGSNDVGDDLPVGLVNTIVTGASAGEGELRVMLRHLPPLNEMAQKEAGLPAAFADGDALPGDVDADVVFDLGVG
jgi:hypothetical protein